MFWHNFILLCKEKKVTPATVCTMIGLSKAVATRWKNGSVPRDITLLKIAEYFGVTIDDLLSEPEKDSIEECDCSFDSTKEKPNPNTTELDDYEKKLIGTFRETTIDGKLRILNAADEIKKDIEKKHNGKNSNFA